MPSPTTTFEIFPALVDGRTSGDAIDWAANLSYDVTINFPDGRRQVRGLRPAKERWALTKVRAIQPNTAVFVASVHGQLQLMDRELPHVVPCTP
jgi:hypothetical protein